MRQLRPQGSVNLKPEADKAYGPAALGVQEKHHACPGLGKGSDGDSAKPEWFDCGDGDSLGEPEGHAAAIEVSADEEPVAHARRRGQRSQGGYGAVETHWVGGRGATCQFGVR